MSHFPRPQHNSLSTLKTEQTQENVFKQANNIMSNTNGNELRNESTLESFNKPNQSISSSKDIIDKIR